MTSLLFLAAATVLLPLHGWAMIDVMRYPARVWKSIGREQTTWVLLVLFLPVVGPVIYATVARPQLVSATGSAAKQDST